MHTLFNQDNSRVLVLGAGSLGCVAARLGDEDGDESAAAWSAAHVDSAELIATGLERKVFLKMGGGPFAQRSLEASIEEHAVLLGRLARGRDLAILCGELSDSVAMRLIEALSAALSEMGVAVHALVIEPFSPNGEIDAFEIERATDRLGAACLLVCALNPSMENVSAGISMRRIRKMAAERLAAACECFATALNSPAEDISQLRFLRGVHRAVFARAVNSSAVSASVQACEAALQSFNEDDRERVDAALISCASEISFRETQAIERAIPQGAALIATANSARVNCADCLLLSGAETAANVVRISASFDRSEHFATAAE
jgi:hypothetical protein